MSSSLNVAKINLDFELNIRKYQLPKVIHIIMAYLQKKYPKESFARSYKRIFFTGNPSLSFQKSDVNDVIFKTDKFGDINVEITINFLSIFGASSPMPSSYCEMVLNSMDESRVLYDFLNIFNHNIEKFVYPVWERNRYYAQYKRDLSDRFSKYVLSFLGLYSYSTKKSDSLNLQKLIPFIGLLSMQNISANTLEIILSHYLSHDEVRIEQCIKSTYNIPKIQQSSMGDENITLGKNFLMGESIVSKSSKFNIILKDACVDDLKDYSVNGKKMKELNELIEFVLNEPLEYDVYFEIKTHNKTEAIISDDNPCYLGVDGWIGDSYSDELILIAQEGIK